MATVLGKNVRVMIYDNGGWRLYACATNCSITVSASVLETSTTGSGAWATNEYEKLSWIATLEGVVNLDEPGKLTLADLRAKQIAFEKILIHYEREDEQGNVYTDEGTALITSSSDTGDVNDRAGFTIELQGTGALTQIFTSTQLALSAMRRYEGTATGGETVINIPSLANMDIMEVVRDGMGYSSIITSGTPVDKQVKYTVSNGDFEWMVPFEPNENYYILYQSI